MTDDPMPDDLDAKYIDAMARSLLTTADPDTVEDLSDQISEVLDSMRNCDGQVALAICLAGLLKQTKEAVPITSITMLAAWSRMVWLMMERMQPAAPEDDDKC